MRTFLVNFIYTSGQFYNADFVLLTQETFPTSHQINKHIQATANDRGLPAYGSVLWTGITELSKTDQGEFTPAEE
jgi:hypothetical protein